jgi:CheY-like chemotaxis protein
MTYHHYPLSILLVDADSDDQTFFREAVEGINKNYHLTLCSGYEELVDLIRKGFHFDLIFLELSMPGDKNGIDCLRLLKSHEKYRGTPVIFFSSIGRLVDVEETYLLGAYYYMIKSFANGYHDSIKMIFNLHDWTKPVPIPSRNEYLLDLKKVLFNIVSV